MMIFHDWNWFQLSTRVHENCCAASDCLYIMLLTNEFVIFNIYNLLLIDFRNSSSSCNSENTCFLQIEQLHYVTCIVSSNLCATVVELVLESSLLPVASFNKELYNWSVRRLNNKWPPPTVRVRHLQHYEIHKI